MSATATDKTLIIRSRLEDYLHMMLAGFTLTSNSEYGELMVRGVSYHYLERGTIRKLERRGFVEPDFSKGTGNYKLTGLGRYFVTQQSNIDPVMHEKLTADLRKPDRLHDLLPWGGLIVVCCFVLGGAIAYLVF